jgi:hypothetical protein
MVLRPDPSPPEHIGRESIASARALGTARTLANGLSVGTTSGDLGMHFDAHQPIINDLEARILTIRDSL